MKRDSPCDRNYGEWEENHVRSAITQVWNVTPAPKDNTREAVLGPSEIHAEMAKNAEMRKWRQVWKNVLWLRLTKLALKSTQKEHRKCNHG